MGGNAAHRPDSVRDIGGRFRKLERAEHTAKGNTLFQLPQGRMFETIVELRLRRQDQRQQFFIGRFDIAKESNFLEQLGREALRLIDNKCCDLATAATLAQCGFKLLEQGGLRSIHVDRKLERAAKELHEFLPCQ